MTNQFWVKFYLHIIAAACLASASSIVALSDSPPGNRVYLVLGLILSSVGSGAVAGKAYLSKASSEDNNQPPPPIP